MKIELSKSELKVIKTGLNIAIESTLKWMTDQEVHYDKNLGFKTIPCSRVNFKGWRSDCLKYQSILNKLK